MFLCLWRTQVIAAQLSLNLKLMLYPIELGQLWHRADLNVVFLSSALFCQFTMVFIDTIVIHSTTRSKMSLFSYIVT